MTLSSNSGLSSITADQPCEQRAKQLNSQCRCVSLNREALHAELKQRQDDSNLYHKIFEDRPHLFAESAVFVTDTCLQKQHRIIAAIESSNSHYGIFNKINLLKIKNFQFCFF